MQGVVQSRFCRKSPNAQLLAYLARTDVRPLVEQVVRAWNDQELLGIDLADGLRTLVAGTGAPIDLDKIDWNQLAEKYAWEICRVGEVELTRRRDGMAC